MKIPEIPSVEKFKDYFVVNNKTVITVTLIGIYAAIQILFPFRHWLYPGNPSWTEEGHKYAWHMKLRDKKGDIIYHVKDPDSNRKWTIYPSRQVLPRQYKKMSTRPNLALQYAHYLAEEFRKKGYENVEVRAENYVSLNGRRKHLLIDPNVNLVEVHDSIFPANWILPLDEPLKRKY